MRVIGSKNAPASLFMLRLGKMCGSMAHINKPNVTSSDHQDCLEVCEAHQYVSVQNGYVYFQCELAKADH